MRLSIASANCQLYIIQIAKLSIIASIDNAISKKCLSLSSTSAFLGSKELS